MHAGLNGRRFIERLIKQVKLIHPYTDFDSWSNRISMTKSKKWNMSVELEGAAPVIKIVPLGSKRPATGKQLTLVSKYSKESTF